MSHKNKITTENLVKRLVEYLPEFQEYAENNVDYHTSSVTDVFMDLHQIATNNIKNSYLINRMCRFLSECHAHGDYDVVNSLIITFFGYLKKEEYAIIQKSITKKLKDEVDNYLQQFNK